MRHRGEPEISLIAVIVPAHNEAEVIGACVDALQVASRCPELRGESVAILVVLDACTDRTGEMAQRAGALTVVVDGRNVGAARARGAQTAIALGARWLAFTDADTLVTPGWLAAQLALGADAVCGTVAVGDWGLYGKRMQDHYAKTYTDADGHRHIHGANLGVSTRAYLDAGGFSNLASSEDVALVAALTRTGASIAWSAAPRVFTSARRAFRAPLGFGATLLRIDAEIQRDAATERP